MAKAPTKTTRRTPAKMALPRELEFQLRDRALQLATYGETGSTASQIVSKAQLYLAFLKG